MDKRTKRINNLLGWLIAICGTAVYLLTMEPTASFWDCGEFIATSHKLMIGHPPGAPVYQLLAHCLMLLAGSDTSQIAWWSNALSAVAGGTTAMFLFWTLVRLIRRFAQSAPYGAIWFASFIGAASYLFCDTAWFSATESEVYSLSMLFSSAIVWAMLRWAQSEDNDYAPRWLMLVSLLLGLSVGVHLLSLLTLPALVLIYLLKRHDDKQEPHLVKDKKEKTHSAKTAIACMVFFVIGLSPYCILPIRAAANPPINMGDPSTAAALKRYITRDQYEHAPLLYGRCYNSPIVGIEKGKPIYAKEMDMFFPRMWKRHENADQYYSDWSGKHGKMVEVNMNPTTAAAETTPRYQTLYKPSFVDNMIIFGGYQLGYMYLRYLMWNFAGRYNDQQGFGNLQRGQFITGIPFVDRWYVGTSKALPPSLDNAGHNRYYLLPLIMGIIGLIVQHKRDKRGFWTLMTLYLMSSLVLSVYLNHPMYEPRERDYAYILSFYTFAIWIGIGAYAILTKKKRGKEKSQLAKTQSHTPIETKNKQSKQVLIGGLKYLLILLVPFLMAFQNWDDHDRGGRYICRDTAANMLNSCGKNGILFTIGDNDTFPLWYLQYVEGVRTDVQIINVSLLGSDDYAENCQQQLLTRGQDLMSGDSWRIMGPYGRMRIIIDNADSTRPLYFSRYCRDNYKDYLKPRTQLCGMVYHYSENTTDSVDRQCCQLLLDRVQWAPLDNVYIDATSRTFLRQYWDFVITAASDQLQRRQNDTVSILLDHAQQQVALRHLQQPSIEYQAALLYQEAGNRKKADNLLSELSQTIEEQLAYYSTMTPTMQNYIRYEIDPLLELRQQLSTKSQTNP